jgi:hypothetical protein
MPQPGEILYYQDFVFADGSRGDKLFVVLSEADIDLPCLVLKTTSQSKRYDGVKQGCNPDKKVFFVPTDWGKCFKCDTYIKLPEIIEIPTDELLRGALSKNIRIMDSRLPNECFLQLKNCLKKFVNDISPRHWKLVFK